MRSTRVAVSLASLWVAASARAEGPVAEPSQPPPGPVVTEAQPAVPVVEQTGSETTAVQGRGIEYGGHLLVPIFLRADDEVKPDPGIGLQGRLGWEFGGGLATELNIGVMVNGSNADWVDSAGISYGDYSLTGVWVGAGLRYAFLNPSAIVPFVGVGVAANIWSNAYTVGGHTESTGDAVISVGGNALVGVAYELNPFIAIEAGVQGNYNLPPNDEDIYAAPELWISPFLGGTLYY